jgi:hypothetical protein
MCRLGECGADAELLLPSSTPSQLCLTACCHLSARDSAAPTKHSTTAQSAVQKWNSNAAARKRTAALHRWRKARLSALLSSVHSALLHCASSALVTTANARVSCHASVSYWSLALSYATTCFARHAVTPSVRAAHLRRPALRPDHDARLCVGFPLSRDALHPACIPTCPFRPHGERCPRLTHTSSISSCWPSPFGTVNSACPSPNCGQRSAPSFSRHGARRQHCNNVYGQRKRLR